MLIRWLVVLGVAACGTVNPTSPDAVGASPDGAADGAPPPCDVTRPWKAPRLLANVSSASVDSTPSLTADELTLYFDSDREDPSPSGAGRQIMVAHRASIADEFGVPVDVSGPVNDPAGYDADPMISGDELSLLFVRTEPGGMRSAGLWLATRPNRAVDFGPPGVIANVNSATWDSTPYLWEHGGMLLFRTNLNDGGDLYQARGNLASGFAAPTPITELNTTSIENGSVLSSDGLTIYFASNRPEGGARGGLDIWTASRDRVDAPFHAPVDVAELSSPADEQPGWISTDGCRLYLDSNRAGSYDLYVSER